MWTDYLRNDMKDDPLKSGAWSSTFSIGLINWGANLFEFDWLQKCNLQKSHTLCKSKALVTNIIWASSVMSQGKCGPVPEVVQDYSLIPMSTIMDIEVRSC